jgi:hypothetical protein
VAKSSALQTVYHGQKRYLQLLLDPSRAQLLDRWAERTKVRTSALVRDLVYDALEQVVPPDEYAQALSEDTALRAASARRQRAGRKP